MVWKWEWREGSNEEFRVSQELDRVDPNGALRLTMIRPLTMSISRRSCDTPFIDYFNYD